MAWTSTGGSVGGTGEITGLDANKVVTAQSYYREERTSPLDPDLTQGRFHLLTMSEFRGLDDTHSGTLIGIYQTGEKVVERSRYDIGAGGYNVIQAVDAVVGTWFTITEPD